MQPVATIWAALKIKSLNIINKLSTELGSRQMMDTVTIASWEIKEQTPSAHVHSQNTKTNLQNQTLAHTQGIFYLSCIPPHY